MSLSLTNFHNTNSAIAITGPEVNKFHIETSMNIVYSTPEIDLLQSNLSP